MAIATLCVCSVGLKERKEGSNVCTSRNGIKMGHEEELGGSKFRGNLLELIGRIRKRERKEER